MTPLKNHQQVILCSRFIQKNSIFAQVMIQSLSLTPEISLVAAPTAVMAELAGEAIILDTVSGTYYGLKNEVGTRIWELIQQPIPITNVCQALLSEYEVDPKECQSDVVEFLQVIVDHGLAEICHEKAI